MSDNFFAELDAEIAQVLAKTNLKTKAAELKRQAFDRTVGQRVRERAMAEWKSIQSFIEAEVWRPVATMAMFTEQQCDGCGSVHRVFLQYMERQAHINRRMGERYTRVSIPNSELRRETLIQPHRTHICADCCEDHGFGLEFAMSLSISPTALSISETYLQGDINATLD
jgi:hypothetical protein